MIKDIKEKKFDRVFIFNSSVRYFLVCTFAGIKNIAQYPLFKKKGQHIVNTAKIFTENEIGKIVSTRPKLFVNQDKICLLYTSPSPRDKRQSRMPSSA